MENDNQTYVNNSINNQKDIESKIQNYSITTLVLGIVSLVFPAIGLITGIIGLVYAKKIRPLNNGNLTGLGIAGYICNIVGVVLGSFSALMVLLYLCLLAFSFIVAFVPAFINAFIYALV